MLGETGLDARLVVVEPTGAATHVTLRLADRTIVAVVRERVTLAPGSMMKIKVGAECLHLFDAATGERLYPDGGRA
jgi:multiple sugar transport system ATP-binding protein